MNRVERDDVAHALGQTFAFYGKELDTLQMKFWLRALSQKGADAIKSALVEYTAIGKYAPKPVDILELIEVHNDQHAATLPPPPQADSAPPHVAKAWAYVIKLWGAGDFFGAGKVDPADADEYLRICNEQAKANNNPSSIPPDAWLFDVWGCDRDRALP